MYVHLAKALELEREFLRESCSIIEAILRFCKQTCRLSQSVTKKEVSPIPTIPPKTFGPFGLRPLELGPIQRFSFPFSITLALHFLLPSLLSFWCFCEHQARLEGNPESHVLKLCAPNEDVLVELQDDRVLQVSVESGNFMSRFKIPDNGFIEQLKASMHNGVLTVVVPKVEASTSSPISG
ncbi:17.5 kda class i heat shock protein [Quercus suber]|uniref:17.5 kDa class i heat shock protein n=1 Tax=Quercus suber TaxID=58331 RepID=A0AAW0LDH2_QUESU